MGSPTNMSSGVSNSALGRKVKSHFLEGWRGYFPAVVTPFNHDLSIDFVAYRDLFAWLIREQMHGFVIAGTTGEWTSLTFEERVQLFEEARKIIPQTKPLIVGCSALRVEETIRYIQIAEQLEVDGVLLTIPPYVCPTDSEIFQFFKQVTDQSSLPFIVYNWPQGTGVDLSLSVIQDLIKIENIVAIKNSTPNAEHFVEVLKAIEKEVLVFGIMPGKTGLALLREHGGDGCIGAAGVLGKKQPGFFEAAWSGDWDRAQFLGDYDDRLMKAFFHHFKGRYGHAISTFKYLLELQGLPAGTVRSPLLPLSEFGRQKVKQLAQEMRLFEDV